MTAVRTVWVDGHPFYVRDDTPPPMDPVEVEDTAPADIDACEHCDGFGVRVTGHDPDTGVPVDEPCSWCDGTGDRRGWAGAA